MLDQDTDRPVSQAHADYWRRRLPNSPGMRALRDDRRHDELRRMEAVLRRKAERLRDIEASLRRRDEALRRREAEPQSIVDRPRPRVAEIARLCAEAAGVPLLEMLSPRRQLHLVRPRQIAAWIARTHTSRSLPEIGKRLGGRDHSTVLHAVRKVDALLGAGDEQALAIIAYVEARL